MPDGSVHSPFQSSRRTVTCHPNFPCFQCAPRLVGKWRVREQGYKPGLMRRNASRLQCAGIRRPETLKGDQACQSDPVVALGVATATLDRQFIIRTRKVGRCQVAQRLVATLVVVPTTCIPAPCLQLVSDKAR